MRLREAYLKANIVKQKSSNDALHVALATINNCPMSKGFDSIEMKRKGAEKLQKKLSGLSLEEELKFWQESAKKLKKEQQQLRKQKRVVSEV